MIRLIKAKRVSTFSPEELRSFFQSIHSQPFGGILTTRLRSGILSLPRESDGDGPEKPERISRRMAAKRLFFVRKDHLHKIVGMIRLLMGEALRMPSRAAVTY